MDIASVAFEIINIDHIDYPFDIGPLKSHTNAIYISECNASQLGWVGKQHHCKYLD